MERALATITRITDIAPISGADQIETVQVRGWQAVVRRGLYRVGDRCLYIEIDAFVPFDDDRFAFLAPRGTKTVGGRTGHVLRTAKLRGAYSQGLVMSLDEFPELADIADDVDVAPILGISKYEPPTVLHGLAVGPYPSQFAPRTDAERVQNLVEVYDQLRSAAHWTATEKIDGTSITYINDQGTLRVASRNLELAPADTTPWRVAAALDILVLLEPGDAVQGELFGEGIQSNPLDIVGQRYAPFALWRDRMPLPRDQWPAALAAIAVPILPLELPETVAACIAQADQRRSAINPDRASEGIVWHSGSVVFDQLDGRGCFKAISNRYLLEHGE
jgi:RNA ligase (TIGR02306 family)